MSLSLYPALDEPHPGADRAPLARGISAHLALIHRAYEAFHRRDAEALLDVLDPDVRWVHPDGMAAYGLGGTRTGHDGVKAFLARVPTVLGGMRLHPQEFVESGDRVVVFGERDVTSASGHTERLRFVHSWTLRDGRAVRMEDIFDTVVFQRLIES
ncbi:nuclear transport factor 2 family protein [Streptomyces sp. NPDC048416]|uniref:nuclear transport factor 2 family protein n=1 Tax=Streptomyces sp. NPDC048416 TaxID=3365546 RepID=UPI0037234DD2